MDGTGVRGAIVRLVADPLPARELTTDSIGRFDFGELRPREYVITASLPGVLGEIRRIDLRNPSAPHDVELVLQSCTASIYGRVVDAAGTAIAGAHVTREGVLGTESDRNGRYELCVLPTAALVAEIRIVAKADGFGTVTAGRRSRRQTAVSQADGSFVLARVPVGEITLNTTPYKNTSGAIHVTEGDHNAVELVVEQLGTLRGTVTRHGVPVPFARVNIAGPSRAGVTADAAGRYEARGLEPGKYGFYCDDRKRGAMFSEDRDLELGASETREHDIELMWGATISGQVVNSRGEPVPGVTVAFRGEVSSECLTDQNGAFACGALAGGSYTASVHPTSAAAHPFQLVDAPAKFELRDGDAHLDNVRLVVNAQAYSIAGVVADGSGAPVSDATVRAFAVDLARRTGFRGDLAAVTDEQGRFTIGDLSSGDYYVEVERGGFATRRSVPAGSTNVTLVLDRPPCEGGQPGDVPSSVTRPASSVIWNRQLELIGWSLPATATIGTPIDLTIVYRAAQPVDRDWRVFAHFDSPTTRVNADHEPAIGWCPTSQWKTGETIVDHVVVTFDAPGRYSLVVGFFTGAAPNWENLTVSAAPASMLDASHDGVHLADIVAK